MSRHDSALILASIAVMLFCIIAELVLPSTHPAPVSVSMTTTQIMTAQDRPIASYDRAERALTVSEHAPRETLVCLRNQCRLVEEWVAAK